MNEEKEDHDTHHALNLIGIDQNPLYSFIEIMVSALESKSHSECAYAPYKSERKLLLNIYVMHQNTPLEIDYQLDVHKFNSETRCGGSIQIHSKSAIIIQKTGTINANECVPDKHTQNVNSGGTISIISDSSITNHGDITSNGTNDECSGGSIHIKCKMFKNFGRIQSKSNGAITIRCHSFDNKNGSIVPKPTIIMPWNYLIVDTKQQRIQLDLDSIADTEREEFKAAALNAKYKIKYFDAQHVEQLVDEMRSDKETHQATGDDDMQSACDLIAIHPWYSFIEIMVSVLEKRSTSEGSIYSAYKSRREIPLKTQHIYHITQTNPLQINYTLNVQKRDIKTGCG
eukprot:1079115_1